MNMIVNTSELVGYEAETKITKASGTQALAKLISTWERKQAVAKRLGGFGLLAVSLAACNNDDDTSAADATSLAAVQAQLAAALDVSRQTVNAIEKGKFDPSLPLAFKAARLFNMAIEEIFQDEVD